MAKYNPYGASVLVKFSDGTPPVIDRKSSQVTINFPLLYHTVKAGETIQSIAFQYYKDSGYWMDIAEANGIMNPFTELEEDTQILIP